MTARKRIVVIGGGVAGLSTAALLAHDGHDVEVIEKNDDLGGRAGLWSKDGFRFDTGPSWWLMPEVFDHYFEMLGTSTKEQLDLVRLDPGYRVFFGENGSDEPPLDIFGDYERNREVFENIEPGAGAALDSYLQTARQAYDLAVERFLYTSFDSTRAFLSLPVLKNAPTLAKLLTRSLQSFMLVEVQRPTPAAGARLSGGVPRFVAGADPVDVSPDELDGPRRRRPIPPGGLHDPRRRTRARRARTRRRDPHRYGRDFRADAQTAGSSTPPSRQVVGVRVQTADGGTRDLPADIVVGAADLHHLETKLLADDLQTFPERYWKRATSGPGAVLAYLGVSGELPELAHHSLYFTEDWKTNFDAIFESPTRVPDPASLYVCKPSATDDSVAPDGHENVFVLVPVPPDPPDPGLGHGGMNGAGDPDIEKVADRAIAMIGQWSGVPDLADRIVVRRTVGPADFVDNVNSWCGGALGPAHTLRQSAFLRSTNRSRKVEGLYYAGSSTRPGIGLPMCLISAELIRKRLNGDRSVGPTPTH
uniref:Putative phytoene desaturase n=1 Tax=Gordonia sp. TM414 TaxID=226326 RepID=Q840X9_9ACTN|nr:putative phytoene desaturase [Gordonia sp. TM414]